MVAQSQPLDIFVSHSAQGRAAARTIAERLESAGMTVKIDQDILVPGSDWDAQLRKALITSDAFVVVVDAGASVPPNATFELGAALALRKPVFVIQTNGGHAEMPGYLRHYATFSLTGIDRLAACIREVSAPLTENERRDLITAYQSVGTSADQLLADPLAIDSLCEKFREISGRNVAPSHIASELLRLRKSGQLPRMRRQRVA